MIVAVTGGTGFVGGRVVTHHLAAGDHVRILTRRPAAHVPAGVHGITGDLATGDIPATFLHNADILYHCAGELRDPSRMHAVHVDGTRALIERARGGIGRWVQLSSVGVYGPRRSGIVTEQSAEAPVGPYETTKAMSDRLVRRAGEDGAMPTVLLRPSNIFGAGMPNQSLVGLIRAVDRGMFFFVGPKGASANYIPVDNVVDALVLCATSPAAPGGVFNVSMFTTMEDFVAVIADALGKQAPRRRVPRTPLRAAAAVLEVLPGWPLSVSRVDALSSRARYATDTIEKTLGYHPRVTVSAALRQLVTAWRSTQPAQ